jgi:hypothetical protein
MNDRKPTPKTIDHLALKYERLKTAIEKAQEEAREPKRQLILLATAWGAITRRARKSFRLDGLERYILATYGESSEIRKDAVQKLQLELVCLNRGRLFRQFFRPDLRYLSVPGAANAIRKIPRDQRRHIIRLYRACFLTQPQSPSLKVEKQKPPTVPGRRLAAIATSGSAQ